MAISQNTALFSLLGTNFGGDGCTTFGLPDLRGRSPMHWGSGPGISTKRIGQKGGAELVTLTVGEIPSHSHKAILKASDEDEKEKPIEAYVQLIQSANLEEQFVLGAFEDETLVGIATFRRDQRSKARHKAMVYAMYVHPAQRGKAIGRLLLEHIIEKAAQLAGMEAIHLWVLHSNTSASGFYQKLGFEFQGLVKRDLKYNDQYIDAEYMVRFL